MDDFVVMYDKKNPPTWFCKICRVLACFLLTIRVAVLILNVFSYSIFINGVPQFTITFIIDLFLIATAVGSINFKYKQLYIVPSVAAAILICVYGTSLLSYTSDINYTSYTSPNSTNTIVLKEDSYMFSGNTKFYKKNNSMLIKDTKESISMDDGYQSISEGRLEVDWLDEDTAEFNYYNKATSELLIKKTIILK